MNNNFNHIAISGKICSGKTTVANILTKDFGYVRKSFAAEIKTLGFHIVEYNKMMKVVQNAEVLSPFFNIMLKDLRRITLDEKEYNNAVNQLNLMLEKFKDIVDYDPQTDKKTQNVRQMFQEIGTEFMRKNVNDNIWVNAVEKAIQTSENERIVIDDLRYPNEFEMLRRNDFVIIRLQISEKEQLRRTRKLYGIINDERLQHSSETSLDYSVFDYTINTDQDLDKTKEEIYKLLEEV